MSVDSTDRTDRLPSMGVDAVALDRYSGIETDDGEFVVYDEEVEDAWIQSDTWTAVDDLG